MLSLFLCVFIALIGIFLLCDLIANLVKRDYSTDYKIPKGWKNRADDTVDKAKVRRAANQRHQTAADSYQSKPKESSDSARYAILIVVYILVLFALVSYWEQMEKAYEKYFPKRQLSADPHKVADADSEDAVHYK